MIKKEGFPEEGELLLCTVTKIFGHSVFVNVEDYNRSGMIHISEISPGRIRNLRDYVVEGKKIVCVVLRINQEKGHIDLSLRRVNEGQKRKKLEGIKQEQKAEHIVKQIAKDLHKEEKQFLDIITEKISKKYDSLHSCFSDIVGDKLDLKDLEIEKDAAEKITEFVKEKMKPKKVIIGGDISINVFKGDGVEIIKKALKKAKDLGKASIKYNGGGTYNIIVEEEDYKKAEQLLKQCTEGIIETIEKVDGKVSFKRKEA